MKAIKAHQPKRGRISIEDRQEIISPKITLEVQFVIYNKNSDKFLFDGVSGHHRIYSAFLKSLGNVVWNPTEELT